MYYYVIVRVLFFSFFTTKTPNGTNATWVRGVLLVNKLKTCTLSILMYNLFLDRQRFLVFYLVSCSILLFYIKYPQHTRLPSQGIDELTVNHSLNISLRACWKSVLWLFIKRDYLTPPLSPHQKSIHNDINNSKNNNFKNKYQKQKTKKNVKINHIT